MGDLIIFTSLKTPYKKILHLYLSLMHFYVTSISVTGGRFPRARPQPPRSLRSLWGHTWTHFSRWKDIGRTIIRPISLRRVTAGAQVFLAALHSNQMMEIKQIQRITLQRFFIIHRKTCMKLSPRTI